MRLSGKSSGRTWGGGVWFIAKHVTPQKHFSSADLGYLLWDLSIYPHAHFNCNSTNLLWMIGYIQDSDSV